MDLSWIITRLALDLEQMFITSCSNSNSGALVLNLVLFVLYCNDRVYILLTIVRLECLGRVAKS